MQQDAAVVDDRSVELLPPAADPGILQARRIPEVEKMGKVER